MKPLNLRSLTGISQSFHWEVFMLAPSRVPGMITLHNLILGNYHRQRFFVTSTRAFHLDLSRLKHSTLKYSTLKYGTMVPGTVLWKLTTRSGYVCTHCRVRHSGTLVGRDTLVGRGYADQSPTNHRPITGEERQSWVKILVGNNYCCHRYCVHVIYWDASVAVLDYGRL